MKLGSLLYVRCRHRSVNCEPFTAVEQGFLKSSFISLQRTQTEIWNSKPTVNRYNERVHCKKQHASSIHTIPSKNIASIQVFLFESINSMQYRSFTFTFAKRHIRSNIVHRTHSRKTILLFGLRICKSTINTILKSNTKMKP